MANPTYAEVETEIRRLCNDSNLTFPIFSQQQIFQLIRQATGFLHNQLRKRLEGADAQGKVRINTPRADHPYWRQYWKSKTIALIVDTLEYSLPSDEASLSTADRFDIFHSLVDASTGRELLPYDLANEQTIKRSALLGAHSTHGLYAFAPGDKIRVLVSPGSDGTPKEVRNLLLRFFRSVYIPAVPIDTEQVDMRQEFTRALALYASYRLLQSKRVAAPALMEEFAAEVAGVAAA